MYYFQFVGKAYLLVTDYYSRWFDIAKMVNKTSEAVANLLKRQFSTNGIPDLVISDNDLQFSAVFLTVRFEIWIYPHHEHSKVPPSERRVRASCPLAKRFLKKNKDPYLALLSYRATPLQNGLLPSESLMRRRLRTHCQLCETSTYRKCRPLPPENGAERA